MGIKDLEKRLAKVELWQNKIISEVDCISNDHAYYSCFSLDAMSELKKERPDLFPEEVRRY